MPFIPRPSQAEILKYQGGTLGISAVPGSGKTHSLSALASNLVEELVTTESSFEHGQPESEILVVTFSNAAVANFAARIGAFLSEKGMIPGIGYRVRTLHSLAAEIVRNRAESFGLDPDFLILGAEQSEPLLHKAVDNWVSRNDDSLLRYYLKPEYSDDWIEKSRENQWIPQLRKIAVNVISQAKDYQLTAEEILSRLNRNQNNRNDFRLLRAVAEIYAEYTLLLENYPAMDFADLMFKANRILSLDPGYLSMLQKQWPVILEDEAQDSSLIQETVLRKLTGPLRNWVRVGDPNQAVYETFTTADPIYLRNFLIESDHAVNLQESGRSTVSILKLANNLIKWVQEEHPALECRNALVPPYIHPTPVDDPQRNPTDAPERIVFIDKALTSSEEVALVSRAAAAQVKLHPQETTAILVPSNDYGTRFFSELAQYQVDVIEILKSNQNIGATADRIAAVVTWFSLPMKIESTKALFEVLYNPQADGDFFLTENDQRIALDILDQFPTSDDFIYPLEPEVFKSVFAAENYPEMAVLSLFSFRCLLEKWLEARSLRVDHMILIIAQDLFIENDAMNIANQIARIARQNMSDQPGFTFNQLAELIQSIAKEANKYPGLNQTDTQFDPDLYRGKIVVTTFHKAKGLEWDQVYLTSCNNFDFPVGPGYDEDGYRENRRSQLHFIRDQLGLQEEALEQLRILAQNDPEANYREGCGTEKAYIAYISERLRLLYVGITRAKKGLQISWNTGTNMNCREAVAVRKLREIHGRTA